MTGHAYQDGRWSEALGAVEQHLGLLAWSVRGD